MPTSLSPRPERYLAPCVTTLDACEITESLGPASAGSSTVSAAVGGRGNKHCPMDHPGFNPHPGCR